MKYSDRELLGAVQEIYQEEGSLSESNFGGEYPSYSVVWRRFGSIGNVAVEAGLPLEDYGGCSDCENWYEELGQHWSRSSCSHPEPTGKQMEILRGLLMSDGYLNTGNEEPFIDLQMTNKEFLKWAKGQLDGLTTDVIKVRTSEEQAQMGVSGGLTPNGGEYNDLYRLVTYSLPELREFQSWYKTGSKSWPQDVDLTSLTLKMLFVGDGHKTNVDSKSDGARSSIVITAKNEEYDKGKVNSLFKKLGVKPKWKDQCRLYFSADDSEYLWEYMGSPPPGFEYKWPKEVAD